tara:strand:+ start:971 stop:2071 length:1101 start_codon:yes stop_codon:yes gene_type:complete
MANNTDIFIISGEKSGDIHGSYIIKNLLKINSSLNISCWGGNHMKNAGGNIIEDYSSYSVMGFIEVVYKLPLIFRKLKKCKNDILKLNPRLILLIDFPGFNLKIAKFAKKNGFKVHYYIPPKVWAWNPSRISILKEYVDKVYSILPFEKEYFLKHSLSIEYVGNPLINKINNFLKKSRYSSNNKVVSLLPGSRISELKKSLIEFKIIAKKLPDYSFNICGVEEMPNDIYNDIIKLENVNIFYDDTYNVIYNSDFSIVMSGTASLEVALLGIPQVVVFKASLISYFIGKLLIKVNYISLVNLVLSKLCVLELIQNNFNSEAIINELKKVENNRNYRSYMLKNYSKLKEKFGIEDASNNVAKRILLSI